MAAHSEYCLMRSGRFDGDQAQVGYFFLLGVALDQLDPSLFAKARAGKGRDNSQKQREIAALEAQIYHLTELLGVSCSVLARKRKCNCDRFIISFTSQEWREF